jgi:putative methionine-R-sulfoxide reductase with GAF domain
MNARTNARRGALEAIDRVLNRGGDADDVLRAVVGVLRDRGGYSWAGIRFVEGDGLVLGPSAGEPAAATAVPIEYQGREVAVLEVATTAADDDDERAFLDRVAILISPYCLVGWDTGGRRWEP